MATFPGTESPWKVFMLISWRQRFFWTLSWSSSFPNRKSDFCDSSLPHRRGLCSQEMSLGSFGQFPCWTLWHNLGFQSVKEEAVLPSDVGYLALTKHQEIVWPALKSLY